ncbi:hypothetical protein UPYG_G00352940 [Umbra pygmaea]|uniref:Uncharacterized protein n=1 Tax=Umbra pygmaea TaxID=75934 RepID=A0ABD0VWP6_UMBPY
MCFNISIFLNCYRINEQEGSSNITQPQKLQLRVQNPRVESRDNFTGPGVKVPLEIPMRIDGYHGEESTTTDVSQLRINHCPQEEGSSNITQPHELQLGVSDPQVATCDSFNSDPVIPGEIQMRTDECCRDAALEKDITHTQSLTDREDQALTVDAEQLELFPNSLNITPGYNYNSIWSQTPLLDQYAPLQPSAQTTEQMLAELKLQKDIKDLLNAQTLLLYSQLNAPLEFCGVNTVTLATEINQTDDNRDPQSDSLRSMLERSVTCSVCNKVFNRSAICQDYLIQLNRPIQCSCTCNICASCYQHNRGCPIHKILSTRASVNTTVSDLASSTHLQGFGEWETATETSDPFKNSQDDLVQQLICGLDDKTRMVRLKQGYEHLITVGDHACFTYWQGQKLAEETAYQYACIQHVKGFWDHIIVSTHLPPSAHEFLGVDENLPHLFGVKLQNYRFHWCGFVLKHEIILSMWCSLQQIMGQIKVLTLVDSQLKPLVSSREFKNMIHLLPRWFKAQYSSTNRRQVKVVFDCKPTEAASLVHFLDSFASKCGLEPMNPNVQQSRPENDMNYFFNRKYAHSLVRQTAPLSSQGKLVDIVQDFSQTGENAVKPLVSYETDIDNP